jgi:type IV secretory pathway TraG/TraD family ATPase VirD4
MIWWTALAFMLFELVMMTVSWLRTNQGGRGISTSGPSNWPHQLTVGAEMVAGHVWLFGRFIAGLVFLGELAALAWLRADLIARARAAIHRSRRYSRGAGPRALSATSRLTAWNARRLKGILEFLGGIVAVRSRLGKWAERILAIAIGILAGALAGALVAVALGHSDRALPSLIAGGVFGLFFACAAYSSDATSRTDGMATGRDLRRSMSAGQVRRTARITRPGLERPGRGAAREYGIALVRQGQAGRWLYASLRDVILLVAPPQTGKTALLGNTVIDAPGALVATSTKPDIFEHTAAVRSGPMVVLNPEGLGGIPTTLRWSPIEGCDRPGTAIERAGYLLAGAPSSGDLNDRNFWDGMNARLLRSLLYAAAVAGRDMHALYAWIAEPGDETPLRILRRHPQTPAGWELDLEQIRQAPMKTRDSTYLTLGQALQWMADPDMAEAACPDPEEPSFNVERFLEERGTLYLLGSERPHGSLGPLFTALTGHIHERAKHLASQRRHGRLDPPLTMVLDEAALICPVPLERWTADSGGRGIILAIAVQSPSQLYDRWGQRGGETIWNNSNIKLVFGGLAVARDLEDLSTLCGDRLERSRSHTVGADMRRSTTVSERLVRVLPANLIRQIPDGQALLLRRNTPPVMGRIRPVWDRSDVRRARKAGIDPIDRLVVPQPVAESVDNVIPLHVPTHAEDADGEATPATAQSS